ncbi:hypothetical protein QR680_002408 [Steinernema hermaphroditum]|uniref:Uncharacterized protein n=1 Tax=Steinernema hermaphroditum TaxID=289476 RepID=A0AA39LI34_9BILA|nr:hypothetical protein QR680_002408 [Steinernema hermaphroditum]
MSTEITKENLPIVVALGAAIVVIFILFLVWFVRFRRTAVPTKPTKPVKCEQEGRKEERAAVEQQVMQKMKVHDAESRRLEADVSAQIGTMDQGVNPSAVAPHNPILALSRAETIAEFENRINKQMAEAKILEDIREQEEPQISNDADDELTPTVVRHPHLMRHLQKTDSRIAMYGGEPFYDVDLNPSLKSVET